MLFDDTLMAKNVVSVGSTFPYMLIFHIINFLSLPLQPASFAKQFVRLKQSLLKVKHGRMGHEGRPSTVRSKCDFSMEPIF